MLQCGQYNGLGECYQWIEIPVAIPALRTCSSLCSGGHGTDANSPTYNHWGASVGEGVVCPGQLPCPCPWVPCEALLGLLEGPQRVTTTTYPWLVVGKV